MPETPKARDLALLDAVDACPRVPFAGNVWRTVREGRDPALGSPSQSRWCAGRFDVLYTSLEKNGALAEVHSFLSLQPVFPSKVTWLCHELKVETRETLVFADVASLAPFGVPAEKYAERIYDGTQPIADAAHFLGFDGVMAPSARWPCANLMLFTDRLAPSAIETAHKSGEVVDWARWRRGTAAGGQ